MLAPHEHDRWNSAINICSRENELETIADMQIAPRETAGKAELLYFTLRIRRQESALEVI